jgi:hypothetical protein
MLTKETALGLKHTFGPIENFTHGILIQEWDPWPIGTPFITPTEQFEKADPRESISAGLLMNVDQNTAGAGYHINPHRKVVVPTGIKPIIPGHRVISIDHFDTQREKRLIEYVHDVGSITLCIETLHSQIDMVHKLASLIRSFKFNNQLYFNTWLGKDRYLLDEEDAKITVINMFNIPYCIPIFNLKRIDGLGISYNIAIKKASEKDGRLHRLAQLDIVLSNHQENILLVDGAYIGSQWPYDKNTEKSLIKAAEFKVKLMPEGRKTDKKEAGVGGWAAEYKAGHKTLNTVGFTATNDNVIFTAADFSAPQAKLGDWGPSGDTVVTLETTPDGLTYQSPVDIEVQYNGNVVSPAQHTSMEAPTLTVEPAQPEQPELTPPGLLNGQGTDQESTDDQPEIPGWNEAPGWEEIQQDQDQNEEE